MAVNKYTPSEIVELVTEAATAVGITKFAVEDLAKITPTQRFWLQVRADEYARQYEGDFAYMVSMRQTVDRKGRLTSDAMTKGVLNCILAEGRRKAKAEDHATTESSGQVPNGTYTIEYADGQHVTVRLTDDFRDDAPDGSQVIKFLRGSDNDNDYRGFGFVEGSQLRVWKRFREQSRLVDAAKVLLGSPDRYVEYGEAFALQSGRCFACGRTLTVPSSLHRGLGPDCAKRLGVA